MARAKRDNGDGSIRKRTNNTWEGQIFVANKKQYVYGKSKPDVKQKIKYLIAQSEIDANLINPDITVKDWLTEWLDLYRSSVKRGSKAQCETIVTLHLIPRIGNIALRSLTPIDVQRLVVAPLTRIRSPKTVHNIYGVLHKALAQAVTLRYISTNPANGCDLPRIPRKETIKPLDKPDLKRLLAALNGDPEEYLFKIALVTGLRSGELIGLTWDCIDFENGVIRIVHQMTSPRKPGEDYEIEETKSSNYRTLSPAPIAFEWLKLQQVKQEREKKALGKAWNCGRYKNLVFTMLDGSHYTQSWVYKMFQRVLKSAGLGHYRVHDLRHTYVVDALRAGDDVKTVQASAGHYSAAFTLDRYAHVTASMQRESAARMQSFLDSL